MAQDTFTRFNYYRRYKWRAQDFTDLQGSLIAAPAAQFEGLLGGAVLQGGDINLSGGFDISINPMVAIGATGDVLVTNSATLVSLSAPVSLPVRSLVVARAVLTDTTFMPRPTNPFDSVPLKTLQSTEILVIPGDPSPAPEYPAKGDGDVVLFGVRQDDPSAVALTAENIDWDVRDQVGKNSLLNKATGLYDDRLRPYKFSITTLGLKPSQVVENGSQLFSYVSRGRVSKYPTNLLGNFVNADSFVNLQLGTITGADAATPSFTPQIPAAGKYKVVTVALQTDDVLNFAFGSDGTFVQCLNAIRNRTEIGAGSVSLIKLPMVCYVIIGSYDGANITSQDILDARTIFGGGGSETVGAHEVPAGVLNGSNKNFTLSQVPLSLQSLQIFLDGVKLPPSGYTLSGQVVTLTGDAPTAEQTVEAFYLQDGMGAFNAPVGAAGNALIPVQEIPSGSVDGSNRIFILSQAPYSDDSLQLFIDGLEVPKLSRVLTGTAVVVAADYAPELGQDISAFYFVASQLGPAPTGGGGGGASSGFSVLGSPGSPIIIDPAVGIISSAQPLQQQYIVSQGGPQSIVANPQITAGSFLGQKLIIIGTAPALGDTVLLSDGNGVSLNGSSIVLNNNQKIQLDWDGSVWSEDFRRS